MAAVAEQAERTDRAEAFLWIMRRCAVAHGVGVRLLLDPSILKGPTKMHRDSQRGRNQRLARKCAMYLGRQFGVPVEEITMAMACDEATVIEACRYIASDPRLARKCQQIAFGLSHFRSPELFDPAVVDRCDRLARLATFRSLRAPVVTQRQRAATAETRRAERDATAILSDAERRTRAYNQRLWAGVAEQWERDANRGSLAVSTPSLEDFIIDRIDAERAAARVLSGREREAIERLRAGDASDGYHLEAAFAAVRDALGEEGGRQPLARRDGPFPADSVPLARRSDTTTAAQGRATRRVVRAIDRPTLDVPVFHSDPPREGLPPARIPNPEMDLARAVAESCADAEGLSLARVRTSVAPSSPTLRARWERARRRAMRALLVHGVDLDAVGRYFECEPVDVPALANGGPLA